MNMEKDRGVRIDKIIQKRNEKSQETIIFEKDIEPSTNNVSNQAQAEIALEGIEELCEVYGGLVNTLRKDNPTNTTMTSENQKKHNEDAKKYEKIVSDFLGNK